MKNSYRGISYPKIFNSKLVRIIWKKYMCPKEIHLFDEVWSVDSHYLCCDACELMVHIKEIEGL